jgi:hypothetical protein
MATSQKSFEARKTRFKNGETLIQSWMDYNSGNGKITKAALAAFILDLDVKDGTVTTTLIPVGDKQNERRIRVFAIEDTNPDCLENRIAGIVNYLNGDHPGTTAAKAVAGILKKIRPKYKKKDPAAPRGAGQSPSEKSFASIVGHGDKVIAHITALGVGYNPPDTNLTVANMQTLVDQIRQLNKDVAKNLDPYGEANRARKSVYDGNDGMNKRITLIKSYLASFSGGKRSNHYIEFSQAIKGV